MSHSWALQKALYLALASNAGLKAEIGDPPRLYDDAPAGAALPYLLLGEAREAPLAGHDGAFEHDLRFTAHSRHGGRREVKRVVAALYDALQDAAIAVEGARLVSLRFVFADVFRRDGELYSAVVRFRAVTEALA